MQVNTEINKALEYIDVRVFSHATEKLQNVETATKNIFPEELAQLIIFQKTNLSGHHSNPIILLTAKVGDKKLLPTALQKFGNNLSTLDKEQLKQNIELHLERGNIYLRFDKQAAFLETLKFSQNDPIHIKIHFKNKSTKEIIEIMTQYGLLP